MKINKPWKNEKKHEKMWWLILPWKGTMALQRRFPVLPSRCKIPRSYRTRTAQTRREFEGTTTLQRAIPSMPEGKRRPEKTWGIPFPFCWKNLFVSPLQFTSALASFLHIPSINTAILPSTQQNARVVRAPSHRKNTPIKDSEFYEKNEKEAD